MAGGEPKKEVEGIFVRVSRSTTNSESCGGQISTDSSNYGRQRGCTEIRLVSHVTRFRAHQFYLKKKMILDGHFFSMPLSGES